MDDFISDLTAAYVLPAIEDDEAMGYTSLFCQDLTDTQVKLYLEVRRIYASKAFLLGLRTGAGLERLLNGTPGQPH